MEHRQRFATLTALMKRGPKESWFTEHVKGEDYYLEPNFNFSQYFFTKDTAVSLVTALDTFKNPCCLCTPRLADEWLKRGRVVTLLDIDSRFQYLPGFRQFDLRSPVTLDEKFDVIVIDPPFFVAEALLPLVRLLARDTNAALFLVFPKEREKELIEVFSEFHLKSTGISLAHCNVKRESTFLFALYGSQRISI